jgi:hypothetical protein
VPSSSKIRVSGTADVGLDVLDRLAVAFGVSVADLVTDLPEDVGEVDEDELVHRAATPPEPSASAPDSSSTPWMKPPAGISDTHDEADLPSYDLRLEAPVALKIQRFGLTKPDFVPLITTMLEVRALLDGIA